MKPLIPLIPILVVALLVAVFFASLLLTPSDPYQRPCECDPPSAECDCAPDLPSAPAKRYVLPSDIDDPGARLRIEQINRRLRERAAADIVWVEPASPEIAELLEEIIELDSRGELGRPVKPEGSTQ